MNRICPSEEMLSKYLSSLLNEKHKNVIEKHLAECEKCRKLLSEAYDIISSRNVKEFVFSLTKRITRNKWLFISSLSMILSFFIQDYFFQFLIISLVSGLKWILDSKTNRTLILIKDAWKNKDHNKQNVA